MSDKLTALVRRTTVVVSNMERSLAFYRDLLGMDVYFEGEIGNPGASAVTAVECELIRMVMLNVGGAELGMVGLMEIRDARRGTAAIRGS